ncbi:hypothetical protein CC78DRAFT_512384 [Lojkania enalia]|uniref:ABC transporter domain-containing protein n=1 Tax=Lojkania enalia TaxID=147567 RepID=A0A9P4N2D9_9PLEO|nr:hypothetical protein CC78DRAFT_512384 [Didymosphaeria enalia]
MISLVRKAWVKPRQKTILRGIDGKLSPGEMLLVLGTPRSGCTTLLKVLAGQTDTYRKWDGSISYSGVPLKTMRENFGSMLAFNGENDNHFPYLTVSQTLEFAASTKTPHRRVNGITRRQYIKSAADILMAAFGLRHAKNTRVGNDFVRGVSGGERRRVSIAEMAACVTCWDNPTRGLDSSTSLDFAQALRVATNLTNNVSISALYQPGDSLANIYDKVLLLHEGRQIFFGRMQDAKSFFEDMGFKRGPRQTTAEFLVSVTDANARIVKDGFQARVPRSAEDFENCWRDSDYYHQLQYDLQAQGPMSESQLSMEISRFQSYRLSEKAFATRRSSPYSLNLAQQFHTALVRGLQRIRGEYAYFLAVTITMFIIPLMMGSMFYDIDPGTEGFFSKGGVIYFLVLFNILINFAEVAAQFAQRPIVEKHHSYAMYHPFVDALATMVAQYPLKMFNILSFTVIIYFLANLKRESGAFFLFVLFVYLSTLTMTTWFRLVAALANTVEVALAAAGLSMLPLAIYAGYIIPRPSMHPWFKWISYINPIYYTVESLMAVEFHGRKAACQTLIPSGPGFENVSVANQVCPVVGAKPGSPFVLGDDYIGIALDYHYSHVWRNLGISILFFGAFTAMYAAASELKKLSGSSSSYTIFRKSSRWGKGDSQEDVESGPSGSKTIIEASPAVGATFDLERHENTLCWKNINYDIDAKGTKLRLLSNIQGYVEPGKLTALMGASGAGKTTLLDVLAQRVSTGVVSGQVTINGAALDASFKRRTGYCQQQDVHMAEMTVREAFRFSALLRQPQEIPIAEKYAYVEKIISVLGMEDYTEAVIGIPGKGLSAEKRKRTTIGLELVARPSLLLFLDEPTSGLDSQSAWSIIKLLRQLSDAGQAILCTIHQPSATLLNQFDRLLLLTTGGKTVYFGDVGKDSETLIEYFAQYGAPTCEADANPAEYILDQVGAGATGHATLDWPSVWANSKERQELDSRIQQLESTRTRGTEQQTPLLSKSFATTWMHQYSIVQKRLFTQQWRSPTYISGKIFINVIGGLFLAFTFYKEDPSVQGLQNRMFSVFMVLLLCLILMILLQPRLVSLRELYDVREKYSNMYHWSVFVIASIIAEIPFNFIITNLGFICWFFPIGWWRDISDGRGAFMWFVFAVYQLYHTTFSQAIAIMAPNAETGAMMTMLFYTFILAFSGVLQPLRELVGFWHFAYYVSPFTWLVSAIMSTGTHAVPVQCSQEEINIFQPPEGMTCGKYAGTFANATGAVIYNPDATQNCQFCRFAVADAYLASVNMQYDERWRNLGFLCAYTVFNIFAFTLGFYLHSGPVSFRKVKTLFHRLKK